MTDLGARLHHVRALIELYELTPDKEEFDINMCRMVKRSEWMPVLRRLESDLSALETKLSELVGPNAA